MKILIIGGTMFFGKTLVSKLLDAGHEITILTRGHSKPALFWDRVSHIECDRSEYGEFKEKLSDKVFDVIIDNVVSDQADIKAIIEVFADRARLPHYIFCSSIAVYPNWLTAGEIPEESVTLDVEEEGGDWKIAYANGKRRAEKYLIEHHAEMPYTIMRPTVIEGPGDPHKRTWFWLQRLQDGDPIIIPNSNRDTLYRHVSPDDVAQAFFLAVGNERAYNQVYNVAGSVVLSIRDYVSSLANAHGMSECRLCWIPDEALAKEFPEYMLPPFFNHVSLIPSIDKIKAQLGFEPTEATLWLRETVDAFSGEKIPSAGYEQREKEKLLIDQFSASIEFVTCDRFSSAPCCSGK